MNLTTNAVRGIYKYDNQVLHFAGQDWIRVRQLDAPFGIPEKALRKVFEREADSFNASDTRIVELPTEGGMQSVRVVSRSGVRLLAALVHTAEAKRMRIAFARGDDRLFAAVPTRSPQLALPGTHRLPADTLRMLDEVASLVDPDHPAQEAIRGFRDGTRPLSPDPTVDHLVSETEEAGKLMSEATRRFSAIRQEAERVGYSLEFIKSETRRRRKAA